MNSVLDSSTRRILAELDAAVGAPHGTDEAASLLITMDWILAGLGVIVGLYCCIRLMRGGWRDPLHDAPDRGNDLREDSLALALLVYLVAVGVFATIARWLPGGRETALANTVVGGASQLAGVAVCLVIAGQRVRGGVWRFLLGPGRPAPGGAFKLAAGGLLLVFAVCPVLLIFSMTAVMWVFPDLEFPDHPTITAIRDNGSSLGMRVALWSSAVVVAPLAEEVFFRGFLQSVLFNALRRRWVAIAISAAFFAVIHQSQPHAIPALFALAVILGYAYERSGSLVAPIIIHALFNLKTLVWDALGTPV